MGLGPGGVIAWARPRGPCDSETLEGEVEDPLHDHQEGENKV